MSVQMATVLIYLTAPEEGGETVFPLEGKHGLDRLANIDYASCNQGLKVNSAVSIFATSSIASASHSRQMSFLSTTDNIPNVHHLCTQVMHCMVLFLPEPACWHGTSHLDLPATLRAFLLCV